MIKRSKNTRLALRRHIVWIAIAGMTFPMLAILVLQYVAVTRLRRDSPNTQRLERQEYLETIANKIAYAYESRAEQLLNLSEKAFADDREVAAHFDQMKWEGARLIFLIRYEGQIKPRTLFFNPATHSLEEQADRPEQLRVNSTTASWRTLSLEGTRVQRRKVRVSQLDPETRILIVPATDGSAKVIGVAGMFVDHDYFRNNYLPRAIGSYQSESSSLKLPAGVIVTVRDGAQQLVFSSKSIKEKDDEVSVPMKFVFTDWRLGVQSDGWNPEQWALASFILTLSLSIVMTGMVIGAATLALRTAAREMRLSQMKSDFVSNVSHELRTPLASIRVFGEFFRLGWIKDEEKARQSGEYIEAESRRLTQLINNILDFSRIESAQKEYELEETDVVEVVKEALKAFEIPTKQRGISIRLESAKNDLLPASIDREALTQAFMNLLDNAVKYSSPGTQITVRAWEEARFINISVADQGIGIPLEEHKIIFEKFYRVSTGLVHDIKGSGLGLAIVKHIVKAHFGEVTVESEQGNGSTFTIRLPMSVDTPVEGIRSIGTFKKGSPLKSEAGIILE